jgi:predicted MFS family arabinose efflux permease
MKKENLLLLVLAIVQFSHIVDFMIVMPLGPQLMRIFHISPKQFSFIVSAYTFAAGISGFAGAFYIDKFDRKTVLLVSFIGFTVGTLGCALAPTYEALLAARIVAGAFGGISGTLIFSIVGDAIPPQRRGSAVGKLMMAFSAASIFGVPAGLYFATVWSWHAPFFMLVALSAITVFLIVRFVPSLRAHLTEQRAGFNPVAVLRDIVTNRRQVLGLLLMVMLMLGQFTIVPFISPYMVGNVGFTEQQLTYIYLLGGALTIFSSPLVGKLTDRYGNYKVFATAVFCSFIPFVAITNMPPWPIAVALVFTTLFMISVSARMVPGMALITSTATPQNRGSFLSVNTSLQQLASALAAYIAGSIVHKTPEGKILHYSWVGAVAIAASIVCVIIAAQLTKQNNSTAPATDSNTNTTRKATEKAIA